VFKQLYNAFMKTVITRTQKAYDAKLKEIDRLFKKLNPRFYREFGISNRPREIYRFPSKYPKGVCLVLKKKCPYCLEQKLYADINWSLDAGDVHVSWNFQGLHAVGEFKRLNPGICDDCISVHHYRKDNHSPSRSNNRKADSGGFWENLFS
jgi:hypothetical protein